MMETYLMWMMGLRKLDLHGLHGGRLIVVDGRTDGAATQRPHLGEVLKPTVGSGELNRAKPNVRIYKNQMCEELQKPNVYN